MYDKIYLVGFDFGDILNKECKWHHYYGGKLSANVVPNQIHTMEREYELVTKQIKDGRIEFLTKDTKITKANEIYRYTFIKCGLCDNNNKVYMWEQLICNYCEGVVDDENS